MDEARKLICKNLGADYNFQSVLNVQKRLGAPYHSVKNEHSNYSMMGLDTGYLLFIANERSRFVIVRKQHSVG